MKSQKTYKGLVLAAGFGSRLRPLTDVWPKPLIPFLGTNPLLVALNILRQAGIFEIAVNTHYQAEKIHRVLSSNPYGLSCVVSHEAEILGTGGVYNPLRGWLGDSDLVVINGDIVSNIDVKSAMIRHQSSQAIATMVVLPNVISGENAVFFRDNRVLTIGKNGPTGTQAGNFACAQILTPKFLELLPKTGTFDIISSGYKKAFEIGSPIGAVVHQGIWHDIGSIQKYAHAVFDLLKHKVICSELGIDLDRVKVTPEGGVIELGAIVGKGASIGRSIVLPGGVVAAHESIDSLVIIENTRIPL